MTSGESNVSAVIPDWSREEKTWFSWQPSRSLLASFRSYQRNANSVNPLRIVIKKFAVLRHRFWSIVTGADIPLNCQIGGGLLLPHPNGVVIHPGSTIGPNCLIFQQVTLGDRNGGVPQLGGHVDIGVGAKIIGQITLSNHSAVGANAVVLLDVPENHIAIGVPAKVYPRS
jgi:serine O-acetyltransferase